MFEHKTFENIIEEMLSEVPEDIDKRQGSIIYDALAPVALCLEKAYIDLDSLLKLCFAQTSNGEYLERRAAEFGVKRKKAESAVREGIFDAPVPKESRFFIGDLYYKLLQAAEEDEKEHLWKGKLVCETPGTAGNKPYGEMLPVNNILELKKCTLGKIYEVGTDEESDKELLNRFLLRAQLPATSGNKHHYKLWAMEVEGVGDSLVLPEADGPGTVKIVLIDKNKETPDQSIIDKCEEHIDKNRPIGAEVTIVGAEQVEINVSADVSLEKGEDLKEVEDMLKKELTDYIKLLAFKENTVRYTQILKIILNLPSVIEYSNLKVWGNTSSEKFSNVNISTGQVAVLGTVKLNEVVPDKGTVNLDEH